MKILIVGNIHSTLNFELLSELKKNNANLLIDFYSIRKPIDGNKYESVIDNLYFSDYKLDFLYNIPIVKTILSVLLFKLFLLKNKKQQYDITNIHFLEYHSYFSINQLKRISKKVVATVYGSDFLAINKIQRYFFNRTLIKSDKVSCTNKAIALQIETAIPQIKGVETVHFGLTPLNFINTITKEQASNYFPELKNKFVITCGYHAHRNNNHLKVLNALGALKNQLPENYIIILQLAYGRKENYIKEIKELVKNLELNCFYIEKFLSNEKLASVRVLSDLSIQTLATDSFSGTVQEYLYTQNVLISGSWLPYESFIEKGIYFEKISNFEELEEKIIFCLKNYDKLKIKAAVNKEIIWKLSSWENNINQWVKLYN